MTNRTVAVVGGGPAGLAAAEVIATAGVRVDLYDAMPSVGRKFLLAGKGGLNLTHSEPREPFFERYGAGRAVLAPMLEAFDGEALREWAAALGVETFVGTSGRVFPREMKAAPLLRAWLRRLRESGVAIHVRHRWVGWKDESLRFDTPDGERFIEADAVVLALGGASWPRLGSDAAWAPLLAARGVHVERIRPANCGFDANWSDVMRAKFAGHPLKPVVATFAGVRRQGEMVVTASGVEGSLVYAFSAPLRDAIERDGSATLVLDLAPARDRARLAHDLSRPRGTKSMANHLRGKAGIDGVKAALLREMVPKEAFADPGRLADAIKALPIVLVSARPVEEAISTAGGVAFDALDDALMLREVPGVFCAGEMLDWEAPTGGYLLTACFATGRWAGRGVLRRLADAR